MWIGAIVIILGAVAVLTGWFDFSALSFKTWTAGETLAAADAAKVVPLGEKLRNFIPAFLALFVIAVIVRMVSAEFTLKRYLEWAFWALIIGLLIANTVGVPQWLKPAIRTEFFIKTGLVIFGFSILFSNIAKFGLYGLGIAWGVTPVVIIFMWWFGNRILKIKNKPLLMTVAAATSVCGTSAAIAAGAVVLAGSALGPEAEQVASLVKMIQNILGFMAASIIASIIFVPAFGAEKTGAVNKVLGQFKDWCFVLAFTSIGLDTNFKQITKSMQGGKVLWLYIVGQTFNIILTFAVVWLLLSGKIFPQPDIKTFTYKEDKINARKEAKAVKAEEQQPAVDLMPQAEPVQENENK